MYTHEELYLLQESHPQGEPDQLGSVVQAEFLHDPDVFGHHRYVIHVGIEQTFIADAVLFVAIRSTGDSFSGFRKWKRICFLEDYFNRSIWEFNLAKCSANCIKPSFCTA